MRAQELLNYFRSLNGGWVDLNNTVDTFKAGNPSADIRGIAVAWMSTMEALQRAVKLGCNVFITHEPTFYSHHDNDDSVFQYAGVRAKHAYIADHELVILRCHDLWDQFPVLGIPDTWGEFLGFSQRLAGEGFYRLYAGENQTAGAIARAIAKRTAVFGQDTVQLIGPKECVVNRIALGTGALTPFRHFLDTFACDMAICTDDGFVYWRDGALALDLSIPVVVVNHTVSELAGMEKLAAHLARQFPSVPIHYVPQTCMFETVQAE